ncbi:hypothetical protein MMC17_008232 [Xylographa soralifera]|nr:hypothetical protein [Xylographa soralifera]
MPSPALHHRRTHNLLLIQRLLSLHPGASPFTLILDSLEQSGKPLIEEYIRRANASQTRVLYIAHSTLNLPSGIDALIPARRKTLPALQAEIGRATAAGHGKTLLIFPTLHPLLSPSLPTFLSSLLTPSTSLLALFHTDVPVPPSPSPYTPAPLPLLRYLATTVLTTHSLTHVLARRSAAQRSVAAPAFGLAEEADGVLVGLGANDPRGTVLEMEYRRKSGRGVGEWFFLAAEGGGGRGKGGGVVLLEDWEGWRGGEEEERRKGGEERGTWEVGLTERQWRDREGVVLPYLDAQGEGGGGGGRILYDLGVEDDFDEEEDEI